MVHKLIDNPYFPPYFNQPQIEKITLKLDWQLMYRTNGYRIDVDIMTGKNCSIYVANVGLIYWSVRYSVGGRRVKDNRVSLFWGNENLV